MSPSPVLAGPNNFGYSAIAVAPQFDDISATGTPIGFFSPRANAPTQLGPSLPSGISFPFFGTTYNAVDVNVHGVITLSRVAVNGSNTDLTSARLWRRSRRYGTTSRSAGSPQSAGYYKLESTPTGNRLVIEWYHVSFVGGPQTGQATFEAILNSDGTILFNYLNFDGSLLRPEIPVRRSESRTRIRPAPISSSCRSRSVRVTMSPAERALKSAAISQPQRTIIMRSRWRPDNRHRSP